MPVPAEHRFLIVRLGSLGDIVHTLPALAALRSAFPQSRIDWIVERKWSPLLELVSGIDRVIPWNRGWAGAVGAVRDLRRTKYTCAIDFQGLYKSALLAAFSGARRKIGLDFRFARERGASFFYGRRIAPSGKHVAERALSLAVEAGAAWPHTFAFPFKRPQAEEDSLRELLRRNGIAGFCLISPGGGWKSKCWPAERYRALCSELWSRLSLRAVVNAGPGEHRLAREVLAASGAGQPLLYAPNLRELVALLGMAKLVIAADTGPLHLAAALGTPVVALFGPTDPDRNGPLPQGAVLRKAAGNRVADPRGNYPRRGDYDPSMLALSVDEVFAAAVRQLAPQT